MKTLSVAKEKITRSWHMFDASGVTLGRLATQIATLLIGKHKSDYTPNQDMGDYVVVINSDKIKLTGNKLLAKKYYSHSNYPGGFREVAAGVQMAKDSRKVIEFAVYGMLPKNKLQSPRLGRLKVYKNEVHPHANHFTTKEQ